MNTGKTLFAQVMEFLPWTTFGRIVARYDGASRRICRPVRPVAFIVMACGRRATSIYVFTYPRKDVDADRSLCPGLTRVSA